ncbi:tabkunin 2-like isoform X1 [Drosophila biarmipes]|uniref:tabkunin 2-like isoform X1 n=1 Tax=Drosophila biarmipes TaxID=125945 RepID=UPI0021CC9DF3|nr:tabkunin 2-like isoform X1 [Drosophila biarmipes]
MKLITLGFVLLALVSSSLALKDAICRLPSESHPHNKEKCLALFRMWTYEAAQNRCIQFTYAGCGGNDNIFLSKEKCEAKCLE